MSEQHTGGKAAVLIVEDDVTSVNAMRMLLEHYGFVVEHASTAAQALQQLANPPKYVFLDLRLPDGDGCRVLEHIRTKQLPITVAVITGTNDVGQLRRAERLKPDMILRKPLDFLTLLERIKPAE